MRHYTIWASVEEYDDETDQAHHAMGLPERIGPFETLEEAQQLLCALPRFDLRGSPSVEDLVAKGLLPKDFGESAHRLEAVTQGGQREIVDPTKTPGAMTQEPRSHAELSNDILRCPKGHPGPFWHYTEVGTLRKVEIAAQKSVRVWWMPDWSPHGDDLIPVSGSPEYLICLAYVEGDLKACNEHVAVPANVEIDWLV
jgi:hypothetical protein